MRYVIVGNGPAGFAAVEALRKTDPEGEIVLVSDEPYPFYSRVLLTYYLAGVAERESLWLADTEWYARRRVRLLAGRRAVGIDAVSRRLLLDGGQTVAYDRLLLATGARPQVLKVPGADLPGVFTLRTLEDAEALSFWVGRRPQRAVVVGGGMIGLKAAEALKARGLEVHVVVSSPRLLSQVLDGEGASLVQEILEAEGYHLHFEEDVVAIEGRERVEGVHLRSGKLLAAGSVVVGKGIVPNVGFLAGSEIKVNRGVLVNERFETTVPGIFAAGDVAEAYDRVWKCSRINALWTNAVEQGYLAGLAMGGHPVTYRGSVAQNSLVCAGLAVFTGGMVNPPENGNCRVEIRVDPKRRLYRKAVLENGRLVGLVAVGETAGVGAFSSLLGREVEEQNVADFLEGRFGFGHLLRRCSRLLSTSLLG